MDLFKYCSSSGAAIFETRTIWFSQAQYLNDPFELNPSTSLRDPDRKHLLENIPEIYDGMAKDARPPFEDFEKMAKQVIAEMDPDHKEGLGKKALGALSNEFAVLCLSKTDQNLPMWAHYAEHYSGFVIQFDGENEFFSPKDGNHIVRDVVYKDERPWFGLNDNENAELDILYTKSSDWKYEQELRLVRNIREGTRVEVNPTRPAYAFNLPPKCIKSVLLGCRASRALLDRIKKCLLNPDFAHVVLMQTSIHKDNFSLEKNLIK